MTKLSEDILDAICGADECRGKDSHLTEWAERASGLEARVKELEGSHRRLAAMMPLFQEARDALCAIPLAAAKLRGIDLTLADRMDDVGVKERWERCDAAAAGEKA